MLPQLPNDIYHIGYWMQIKEIDSSELKNRLTTYAKEMGLMRSEFFLV